MSCIYCVKCITLCNCLWYSSCCCFSASIIRNIREFRAKNYFTDHQTVNTIHGIASSHSYPSDNKARTVCWCKQPTSNSFQTLQTVYTYSNCTIDQWIYCWKINVLANICSEISKIWLILWMVYTCIVKGYECTLHRWRRLPVMSNCSRPYQ